jgi:hypothetical protein
MAVILVFIAFAICGVLISIAVASSVEQFAPFAGLLVFFALFIGQFIVSWVLATRVSERYLLPRS